MVRFVRLGLMLLVALPTAAFAAALPVKVMVLTAFPAELAPWLGHMDHPNVLDVAGAYAPVWCDRDAVCVTETGEGEVNAAASVVAIHASPENDHALPLILRAGIAGGPPWGDGTLGSAYWVDWVVSWSLGYHLPAVSHGADEPRFRRCPRRSRRSVRRRFSSILAWSSWRSR